MIIKGIKYNGETINFSSTDSTLKPKIEVIKQIAGKIDEGDPDSRIKLHCFNLIPDKTYIIKCYVSGKSQGSRSSGWHHPLNEIPPQEEWTKSSPTYDENGDFIECIRVPTDDERIWSGHFIGTRSLVYTTDGIDESRLPAIAASGRGGILETEWIITPEQDFYYLNLNYPTWLIDLYKKENALLGTHSKRSNSRFFKFTIAELDGNSIINESELSNTLAIDGEVKLKNNKVYSKKIQVF